MQAYKLEKFEKLIQNEYDEFSTILKNSNVISIKKGSFIFCKTKVEGEQNIYKSKSLFLATNTDFVNIFEGNISEEVIKARKNLNYRNHISVHLAVDKKLLMTIGFTYILLK